MSSRALLVLADAAVDTGVGHYVRSAALGVAASARGWEVTVALQPDAVPWVADDVSRRGWHQVKLERDVGSLASAATRLGTRDEVALVIDSYRVDSRWLADARQRIPACLLVIDDLAERALHADIVLNQNVGAEEVPMSIDPDTEALVGPAYALLRPEFAERRAAALANVERLPDRPKTVLVVMGGTDPTRSAVTVGLACSDAFPQAAVTVVSAEPAASSLKVRVVDRIDDMAAAMSDADLVVTAAGSTLWEVCCLGRPAAAVRVADNQRDVYGRLSASGIVQGLGGVPVDRTELATRLRAMTAERGALRRLASAAANLVDGRGAERVIRKLEARMERQSLWLCP